MAKSLSKQFFYGDSPDRPVLAGDLLIAAPLEKEHFSRSVVLIIDSDKAEGKLGLVLNKRSAMTLKDLVPIWDSAEDIPVFIGGPVENDRLFMLHTLGDEFPGSIEILPGLFVGGSTEAMVNYIREGKPIDGKIRFFAGYAGWGSEQLEAEIDAKVWCVAMPQNSEDLLSGSGNAFWRREVKKMGERYRGWLSVPSNPDLN